VGSILKKFTRIYKKYLDLITSKFPRRFLPNTFAVCRQLRA